MGWAVEVEHLGHHLFWSPICPPSISVTPSYWDSKTQDGLNENACYINTCARWAELHKDLYLTLRWYHAIKSYCRQTRCPSLIHRIIKMELLKHVLHLRGCLLGFVCFCMSVLAFLKCLLLQCLSPNKSFSIRPVQKTPPNPVCSAGLQKPMMPVLLLESGFWVANTAVEFICVCIFFTFWIKRK